MSDKNRNMNDINDQKTAEQQAFSEEIRRRLAEPGSGKPTLDEFKVMVYKDREKRRKKRNALVACIVAAFIVGYLTYDDLVPEVGADKNPKETIQTEDGVIIEDGGYGSSVGEENVWVIEDWEQVEDAKQTYSNFVLPNYTPKGFIFKKLTICSVIADDRVCSFIFENTQKDIIKIEILYVEGGEQSTNIDNISRTIYATHGKVYIHEKEAIKKATTIIGDGMVVRIFGNITDDDLVKIIENMTN